MTKTMVSSWKFNGIAGHIKPSKKFELYPKGDGEPLESF